MTSEEKWQWVCEELQKLKDMQQSLDERLKAVEKVRNRHIGNGQGNQAFNEFKGIPKDNNRPPLEGIGK